MTTAIAAVDLKRLWGQSFVLKQPDQASVKFSIPKQAARGGFEGYGLVVDCRHPIRTGFLKIFKYAVAERHERTKFLKTLGLTKYHWLFQGLPFGALQNVSINGLQITGYVTRRIVSKNDGQAKDLARLMANGQWNYDLWQRRRFCGQLCCAVVTLEGLDLVHGDISLGNVMIGTDGAGEEAAVLCDFDAFFHPSQPLLPLTVDKRPCRPSGTDGFQYPELLADLDRKSPDVCVRTDRFALGAVICQMMTWNTETDEKLQRTHLLRREDIASRDLSKVPDFIRSAWPQGLELLQEALRATSIKDLPGPKDWLALVGGPPPPGPPPFTEPTITLYKRLGRTVLLTQSVGLKSSIGTFARVDREVEQVSFAREGGKVFLEFRWVAPVFRRREGGPLEKLGTSPLRIEIAAGDRLTSNSWDFEVKEGS